LLSITWTKR